MTEPADVSDTFATPRVAAGALITDTQGRILMLRPTYKAYWDIPGGYIETGETPTDACVREVREELGLDLSVGGLLVADWSPHPEEGDKLLFVFDGGTLTEDRQADIRFTDGEIADRAFVDADRLEEVTVPRLTRRLRHALQARRQGRTLYLQAGEPPASPGR